MRRIFLWFVSGRGLLWLLLVWAAMLFVDSTGMFRMVIPSTWQVLQAFPSKVLSIFVFLSVLGILIRIYRSGPLGGKLHTLGIMLYLVSIITLCVALWVSAYTHFEGDLVRTEGETFNAFPSEYLQQTMFFSSRQSLPQVGMTFTKVRPSESGGGLDRIEADVLYAGRTTDGVLHGTLSSSKYFISDWALARIVDFGYSVRFSLLNVNERELESAMLPLKTYPPGTEDKFEATFPGYQFYVQVYPDYLDQNGKPASKTILLNNPAIRLRITRNKDIVYNDILEQGKKLRFDNLIITFPETSYWVEVRMVRDLGLPVAAGGALLLIAGMVLMVAGRVGKGTGTVIP
jgi:hypothetical protein